jgi:hypothetical protein
VINILNFQVIWKTFLDYSQSSRDHGTLWHFKSLLNRASISKDQKKYVNATVDFLLTVVKGHMLAAACQILGVTIDIIYMRNMLRMYIIPME